MLIKKNALRFLINGTKSKKNSLFFYESEYMRYKFNNTKIISLKYFLCQKNLIYIFHNFIIIH